MKTENHCILSKLHSDLIYIDFRMCEHSSLSKFYGDLQQTPSFWHRTARGTTRSARDPSGTTRLRTCPQDDIVEQSSTVGSASAAEHRRFPRKTVRVDERVRNLGSAPAPRFDSANISVCLLLCKLIYRSIL